MRADWWRDALLYHIYVRSFADSDGDGVGDLGGVAGRLDHLSWLGVDAIWLSPTSVSPDADFGYDVSDYRHVQPSLGGDAALEELIAAAHGIGIRVLLDLVPNHTSTEHPWFIEARRGPASPRRNWYVWADERNGGPPNNWLSDFRQDGVPRSAWTLDPVSGQWYLCSFLPEQVDLNWRNPEVRAEFLDILASWFGRGVDGVRIDVAHKLVVDDRLRDNPPPSEADDPVSRLRGQLQLMNAELPEVHDILRSWRDLAGSLEPQRLLLGETYVGDPQRLAPFYGAGDELHLALNIPFLWAGLTATDMRATIDMTRAALPDTAWPLWCASSHDDGRFATRWCTGDQGLVRCALLLLLTLRGTPLLYYGDEIGMTEVDVPRDRRHDRGGERDRGRTPMPWSGEPGAGFTRPGVEPWLPLGDFARSNVGGQRDEPGSTLRFCRDLVAARRRREELRRGSMTWLPSPSGVLVWRRGSGHAVAVNLGDRPADVAGLTGRILVATDPGRSGESILAPLALPGRSGVLVALS
ncbi:MAG: alpha-amylase family glycosyl hydrolase [Candidatus Dormiibacterota bacterium]